MSEPMLISAAGAIPDSPARKRGPERVPLRIGAVQECWRRDPLEHRAALMRGVQMAAREGATVVCLQELTLSPYFAVLPDGPIAQNIEPESLDADRPGATLQFASAAARETGVWIHASLFEVSDHNDDGRGYNTAILVDPEGRRVTRTRKLHIPVTAGYYEDQYFEGGPASNHLEVTDVGGAKLGLPTCWDQWFGELARMYALAGADVIIYPTAIGSEPEHPDFDTQPLWEKVITGNGIQNGTFMVAVNRVGTESPLTFYGSSFISDPYGRILVRAPRDRPAVIVADLDLDQRRDWLELFPFFATRRPDAYGSISQVSQSTR
jgi:N-carbamoylputrescine amidase